MASAGRSQRTGYWPPDFATQIPPCLCHGHDQCRCRASGDSENGRACKSENHPALYAFRCRATSDRVPQSTSEGTMRETIERFLLVKRSENMSPNTIRAYG